MKRFTRETELTREEIDAWMDLLLDQKTMGCVMACLGQAHAFADVFLDGDEQGRIVVFLYKALFRGGYISVETALDAIQIFHPGAKGVPEWRAHLAQEAAKK